MSEKNIMTYENVLPADFDGTFKFTNWSKTDFVAKWGGKEYIFPAGTTSPMVIPEHTLLEIQQIRKKFAKDLAEREFFNSRQYEALRIREGVRDELGMIQPRGQGMSHAGTYSLRDLTPLIQKCLVPLPVSKMKVQVAQDTPIEEKLTKNEDGELNTEAIDKKVSLKERALNAQNKK
jgi:hypothetical protein